MQFHLFATAACGGVFSGIVAAQQGEAANAPPTDSSFQQALDQALRPAEPGPNPGASGPLAGSLRLLDLSFNGLLNAGSSSERDDVIDELQLGGHDPKQRGFTLSQLEFSAIGAVDPFFQFESHLIYFLTPEGESEFEIEEVFARSSSLSYGLQLKAGQYFTEFGRINSQHPHAWDFIDQPVIHGRVFGPDGMRAPGARLAWLAPVPWFAELTVGMQDARGETMASFRGTEEELAPGGRAIVARETRSLADFAASTRLLQSFDLSEETVGQLGLSGAFGGNGAGGSTRTALFGADFRVKWQPKTNDAGWPFLVLQGEAIRRTYGTELQTIDPDGTPASGDEFPLAGDTLHDSGGYLYALWGFRRDWAAGLRFELARSSGAGVDPRADDPLRDDRQRFSPLVVWHPSHFSRVRLQYNLDFADHLAHDRAHSVWLGLEFVVGNHPAHSY
jgi:hypothetical protein